MALELAEAEVKKALQIISNLENINNVYSDESLTPTILTMPNYVFYDSEA